MRTHNSNDLLRLCESKPQAEEQSQAQHMSSMDNALSCLASIKKERREKGGGGKEKWREKGIKKRGKEREREDGREASLNSDSLLLSHPFNK